MVLDIDHFKKVNDNHGHDVGDEILKGFAARVKRVVRGSDLLCRFGGEEFVIVMPETGLAIAKRVAERVRAAVAGAPFPVQGGARSLPITVSIGVAESHGGGTSEALFKRADQALYLAKSSGRNRVTADESSAQAA
jgi:two-component system cell cycle response regulator